MDGTAPAGVAARGAPYDGDLAVLATKHGKLGSIAPELARAGLVVQAADVDTDVLGTFTGEVPRSAPPLETAVAKARLGMVAGGIPLGVASEGSVGPDPDVPWLTVDDEIVVLVDDRRGIVVAGRHASSDVVAVSAVVGPGAGLRDRLRDLARQADLPDHAVTVVPSLGPPRPVRKGLRRIGDIADAVEACAAASPDGLARVATDLRAHCCPSRRAVIRAAAADLAHRLGARCPACGSPGWGLAEVRTGVPCAWCGAAVGRVRAEVDGCPACGHRVERPVLPASAVADPGECARCNP